MSALTPAYALRRMAENLDRMEEAQTRFAAVSAAYAGTTDSSALDAMRASSDPRITAAASDTAYYQGLTQTYAAVASALLAGLARYGAAGAYRGMRDGLVYDRDDPETCVPLPVGVEGHPIGGHRG